jgi:hypothetical protein
MRTQQFALKTIASTTLELCGDIALQERGN